MLGGLSPSFTVSVSAIVLYALEMFGLQDYNFGLNMYGVCFVRSNLTTQP